MLQLWHAGLLVREHRGDGHVTALRGRRARPSGDLVTGGLASDSTDFVRTTRGWSDAQWAAGERRCRDRGLVDDGRALRQQVEETIVALRLRPAAGWISSRG